jgi:hypothetical protein
VGAGEVRLDDIGTVFEITVKKEDGSAQDISAAATRQIIFKKPDGTLLTKTAALVTDGLDGKMKYKAISGDLDAAGSWELQGRVILAAGTDEYRSDISGFEVHANL